MRRVLLACVFARAAHAFALHGASAPCARGSVASHRASAPSVVRMAVDTTPSRVELTQNYRDAEDRSARFAALKSAPSKRVVVVGHSAHFRALFAEGESFDKSSLLNVSVWSATLSAAEARWSDLKLLVPGWPRPVVEAAQEEPT